MKMKKTQRRIKSIQQRVEKMVEKGRIRKKELHEKFNRDKMNSLKI